MSRKLYFDFKFFVTFNLKLDNNRIAKIYEFVTENIPVYRKDATSLTFLSTMFE